MKKQVIIRGLLGIPLGITFSYVVSIFISIAVGDGAFYPCVPSLIQTVGSELGAVILQTVLSGLLGASYAAASCIWEMESWSIAKQTGLYFAVLSLTMLPIAYLAEWMDHSITGFLLYFGIFVAIFVILWLVQYLFWKNKIRRFNSKIDKP